MGSFFQQTAQPIIAIRASTASHCSKSAKLSIGNPSIPVLSNKKTAASATAAAANGWRKTKRCLIRRNRLTGSSPKKALKVEKATAIIQTAGGKQIQPHCSCCWKGGVLGKSGAWVSGFVGNLGKYVCLEGNKGYLITQVTFIVWEREFCKGLGLV